uniref:Protein FAM110C-like n=1 Tax=Sinocyclocheilus anshuiensis TaxID=1608454 RepID=A0A671K2P2_9TELE
MNKLMALPMDAGSRGCSVSAVERLEADKAKYVKSQQVINTKQEPVLVPCATPPPVPRRNFTVSTPSTPVLPAPIMRRSNGKRMLRPDSLVIYRQKKECKSPSGCGENANVNLEVKGYSFVRRLFQGSMREKSGGNEPVLPQMRSDLKRSKSELRLRCSLAMSEQERFFDYCGLDLDMVERLGPENFLNGASSVDTLSLLLRSVRGGGSEPSEFSRHSGEGLFQEELAEQIPTGVSIIERNARVIKWLYGCRNAAQEGPKESTV